MTTVYGIKRKWVTGEVGSRLETEETQTGLFGFIPWKTRKITNIDGYSFDTRNGDEAPERAAKALSFWSGKLPVAKLIMYPGKFLEVPDLFVHLRGERQLEESTLMCQIICIDSNGFELPTRNLQVHFDQDCKQPEVEITYYKKHEPFIWPGPYNLTAKVTFSSQIEFDDHTLTVVSKEEVDRILGTVA